MLNSISDQFLATEEDWAN